MAKMAKKNDNSNDDVAEVMEQKTTETSLTIPDGMTVNDVAEKLKQMQAGEEDSGYFSLEPGEEKKVLFIGMEKIWNKFSKQRDLDAAVFVTESGKQQLAADTVLVGYFGRQTPGCARKIVCTNVRQSQQGEYKDYKFYELI